MKLAGVGGRADDVPIAREGVGGEVGRRERRHLLASSGCSKTYCVIVSYILVLYAIQ